MASCELNALNMRHLLPPAREYRLDLLVRPDTHPRTGNRRSGFETVARCEAEDRGRASALRAIAESVAAIQNGRRPTPLNSPLPKLNIDPEAALNLAERLEVGVASGDAQPTFASALFMRGHRLQIGAELLELTANSSNGEVMTFTVIHPTWTCLASRLMDVDARQIKNQFRTHLSRAGVTEGSGFFFARLHGEFEPNSKEYQLHFHGVIGGEKLRAFNKIRNTQGYVRTGKIHWPIVVKPLEHRARQLSYIVQNFWPAKPRIALPNGVYRRARTKGRIDEPYHSLYLPWLDRWEAGHLQLLNGIRF